VHFQPADLQPVKLNELSATLYSTEGYMGNVVAALKSQEASPPQKMDVTPASTDQLSAANNQVRNSDSNMVAQLLSLRDSISDLRKQMLNMDPKAASEKLAAFQQALFNDVSETFQSIHDQDDRSALRAEDLPAALRHRFIGVTGKYLIQVYPREDIWQHDKQEEFIKEVSTVDPNVTGTPVQLYHYTKLLKDSYIQAAYYALAVIAIMVLIHFRSITYLILALLPVAIGTIWMGGLMGVFGIPFNPANIMTLPLVIGIGVTNGIHILNRYVEEHDPNFFSKSTGKAVFVSGLTTISGFGSLMLAKHQGIRSLGEVMSMGVALCMIAALTFLPAVLHLRERRGTPAKQPEGENAQSHLARERSG
jgi:hypothetical protein